MKNEITATFVVWAVPNRWGAESYTFRLLKQGIDPYEEEAFPVATQEVTIPYDMPSETQCRNRRADRLVGAIADLRADMARKEQEYKTRILELRALPAPESN